jgi:hypothetical protein
MRSGDKKIGQILEKSSQNSCRVEKCQNINIKAQLKAENISNFESLKCLQKNYALNCLLR